MVSVSVPQLVALILSVSASSSAHSPMNHKHHQHANTIDLSKRAEADSHIHNQGHHIFVPEAQPELQKKRDSTSCAFPTNAGLVSVTPNSLNAGWAMSPDQACTAGSWCPYACPPGQVSLQWDPSVTTYSYPGSQYGGLYCNANGEIEKPFSSKDLCADGAGTAVARNLCSKQVAFCQTVLPGNEAMLIPTNVDASSSVTLAVPDTSYWASTAAHFYINPPGYDVETACVWGTNQNPYGNWSPYVAGANTDNSDNTFIKIGWNPIYLEETTPFRNELPSFGVRIVCDDESQCVGLPCSIDPSTDGINGVTSNLGADGAGNGAFCVVTATKGAKAHIEVFDVGTSSSSTVSTNKMAVLASPEEENSSEAATPTYTPTSSSTSTTSTTSSTSTSTTSTSTPIPTPTSTTPSSTSTSTSTSTEPTTSVETTTISSSSTSLSSSGISSEAPTSSSAPVSSTEASTKNALSVVSMISRSGDLANLLAMNATIDTSSSTLAVKTHEISLVSSIAKPSAVYNLVISANVSTETSVSSSSSASSSSSSSSHHKNGANNLSISVVGLLVMASLTFML